MRVLFWKHMSFGSFPKIFDGRQDPVISEQGFTEAWMLRSQNINSNKTNI